MLVVGLDVDGFGVWEIVTAVFYKKNPEPLRAQLYLPLQHAIYRLSSFFFNCLQFGGTVSESFSSKGSVPSRGLSKRKIKFLRLN